MIKRVFGLGILTLALAASGLAPSAASADGTLDSSFAGTGQLALDAVPAYDEYVQDMTVDSRGRLLVLEIGTYRPTGYTGGFVIRFLEDGTIDNTFSVGDDSYGSGVKAIGSVKSLALDSIALDSQGRIVLGGGIEVGPVNWDLLIVRLMPDGGYDSSFGTGGLVTHDLTGGSYDRLRDLQIDSAGRYIAGGSTQPTAHAPQGMVARFTSDGELDAAFSDDGWLIPFPSDNSSGIGDLKEDPTGRILVAGRTGENEDFTVLRLKGDGTVDSSFGEAGIRSVVYPGSDSQTVVSLNLDSDRRIVLTGRLVSDDGSGSIGLMRLTPDGQLDSSFGEDGMNRIDSGGLVEPNAAGFDKAGRLVIQSEVTPDHFATLDGLFTRLRPDGSLDPSFGEGGFVRESRPDRRMYVTSMLIDDKGRYLMAGSERLPDDTDQLAISRYSVDYPKPTVPRFVKCQGKKATIVGTNRRDRLKGTRKRDVIVGFGKRDVIEGRGGNDVICGGAGNDKLIGGAGNDLLVGGPGKDRILGGRGKDRIFGGKGRDRCQPGRGKGRLTACERRR